MPTTPLLAHVPHAVTTKLILRILKEFLPPPKEAYYRYTKVRNHVFHNRFQDFSDFKYEINPDNGHISSGSAYHYPVLRISFKDNKFKDTSNIRFRYIDLIFLMFGHVADSTLLDYVKALNSATEYRHNLASLDPNRNPYRFRDIPELEKLQSSITELLISLNNQS